VGPRHDHAHCLSFVGLHFGQIDIRYSLAVMFAYGQAYETPQARGTVAVAHGRNIAY
jgi:hypothetical protein